MGIKSIALAATTLVLSTSANAFLIERLGGLAYYDTDADLTWLADANYAYTSGYINTITTRYDNGRMEWGQANAWAAGLSVGGVGGWRLPDTAQPDPGCSGQYLDTYGFGFNCTGSEMGNLFYNVLGGSAGSNITTTHNGNYDLFSNVLTTYWSATEYGPWSTTHAHTFTMNGGGQGNSNMTLDYYAWAVHDGDVSAVPVPAAVWLFGSGLLGLIGLARRKKA